MARQSISELKGNHSVAAILDQGVRGKVELLAEQLVERAKHVDGTEEEDTKKHLAELIDFWCEFANNIVSNGKEHVYWHLPWEERKTLKKKNKDLEDYELLKRPDDYTEDGRIKTPTSMRDVEPPTNVQLIFKGP